MKCLKCGYKRQVRDDAFVPPTECPSCGIVYAKHDAGPTTAAPAPSIGPPAHLRPSPVDPESLKKAKERVEKRLRDRLEVRVKDKRYAQTLKMARKISANAFHKQDLGPETDQRKASETLSVIDQSLITESENRKNDPDEALLLEDMVGVQIHDNIQAATEDTVEEKMPAEPTEPEDSQSSVKAVAETEAQDSASSQAKEPEEERRDPEDVQIQTVPLPPMEESIDAAPEEYSEYEREDAHEETPEETLEEIPAHIAAASTAANGSDLFSGLLRLLPVVAWLMLFAGLIGAVLSWVTISDVEAGVGIPVSDGRSTLPLGLLLGFAYLATGVLGFAFFWAASLINRQLMEIRRLLMVHPIAMMSEQINGDQHQPDRLQQSDE
jgi:hypothetical protein